VSARQVRQCELTPLDRLVVAFVAGMTLVLAAYRPPEARWIAAAHVLVLATVALAVRARRLTGGDSLLADFYPLAIDWALYAEVGLLNRARGVSYDGLVQGWEQRLFGTQPSQAFMAACPSPVLSTLLHAAYLAKYPMLLAPLVLWTTGRRAAAREVAFLTILTFYSCYALFLLFPVAGPRYVLPAPSEAAAATATAAFTRRLLEAASAWGTAFPSAHVAVTIVVSAATWRFSRRLGAPLFLLTALLAAGTVYGGFHYAIDVLAGAALAVLLLAGWRLARRCDARPVRRAADGDRPPP
jgi:membrane-associated phospholipid phosphatase